MKKIVLSVALSLTGMLLFAQLNKKFNDTTLLKPIEVLAVRAADNAPFAKTNFTKKEIERNNLGQDLPFLLNQTPSVVVNSDAGNGVGYTGIRIRGTDATRINVTLNGIPYNDAESQGTFLVDLPDFSSSINSIQIQRGVGTSTNGSGAFGATINLSTNEVNDKFYAELNNTYGSFNTWKNTFKVGSGLIGKHFTIDGRLSNITSDGYIERAKSDLKSYYLSTAYLDAKNSLRLNIFSGKEKTYQAWNGVSESDLLTNRRYNVSGQEQPGKPYENETDNYTQTHYQLFYNHQFNTYWKTNLTLFLTKGAGYYEQYKAQSTLLNYGVPNYVDGNNSTISKTDLIRRLWLDNDFYGTTFSVQHQKNKTQFTAGGGWNNYDGKHFGEIIWAKVTAAVPANFRWYNLTANKKDFSLFTKWAEQWDAHWQSYADLQVRTINYRINGFRDNPSLLIKNNYTFINPKFGITYTNKNWQAYLSYAIAGKEPNRDDFEAGTTNQPKAETLFDTELGVEKKSTKFTYGANLYYMKYNNQLVLTGKINDVGAYTRTNIPNSYRIGIELQGKAKLNNWLNISANAAFSQNKVIDFTEYIDDYDNGGQVINQYKKTNISFSPAVVAGYSINFTPIKNAEINLLGKQVSRQYMDNTSQKSRSLNGYYVQDIRLSYLLEKKFFKATNVILQLNNVFNKKYEPNGYTYSYIYGGLVSENYYFPMAQFNMMLGVNVKL
jgi:iron complex outermembrane receptor protein